MQRVLLVLLAMAIPPASAASQDCIDYGDYMHQAGMVDAPGYAWDVAVHGNYTYVADGSTWGHQVIDISTTDSPMLVGSLATLGNAYGVTVADNYAYIADGGLGLHVVDISVPEYPASVGVVATPGDAWDVSVA